VTDADAARLRELGYEQQLERRLGVLDTVALGVAGISPVVGLYAVVLVGTVLAGPSWVWVLPVALAGQCLLIAVYAELARDFPLTGGAYQWTRRLVGERYGWFAGWVAICAYAAANTTVAYLGAPWALTLLGIEPSPGRTVLTGAILVVVCALAGAFGVTLLGRAAKAGITAEVIATVFIGLALLLAPAAPSSPHWRSAAGCSSVSTSPRAPPRRPATPRAMSRGRSGSRCSGWGRSWS
jgi:amino acid transporter